MSIRVRIPEVLRRYTGDAEEVTLEAATAASALDALVARFPALAPRLFDRTGALFPYLLLFRNDDALDRRALARATLAPGDLLELIGAAEGGAPADPPEPPIDPRGQGFRRRTSAREAIARLLSGARPPVDAVEVASLAGASGRVLADDVVALVAIPPFRRSAMDGYAVRAEDTFGASSYAPRPLRLVGEALAGGPSVPALLPGEAVRVTTGAVVPDGADAVLVCEHATEEPARAPADGRGVVLARAAVAVGKHVGRVGEDVERGQVVLRRGRCLRPQDVALLASLGRDGALVRARPRVRLIASGNELRAPGEPLGQGAIYDSNTPMLEALVRRDGGEVERALRVPDQREAIEEALTAPGAAVIICTGGTSVGSEDYLPQVVRSLGALEVHGIACRPAAPTGFGRIGAAYVLLLPGNPVSCLCAYDLFAGPVVRRLSERPEALPYPRRMLPLARKVVSELGRLDYLRVAIDDSGRADPIAVSGASILSSTTRADGFALIAENSEGFPEGASIEVYLYDGEWAWAARQGSAAWPPAEP